MRFPSGVTDQYVYFVAVDAADFATRETGITVGNFSCYRSRNGAASAAYTTPTFAEVDATNMPGVYSLLLDEDMTIAAGNDSEEMVLHIKDSGGVMTPVTRTIELYRPKITAGNTLSVESDGDLTKVDTLDGHTAQTGDNYARLGAPAGASIAADLMVIEGQTDDIGVAGAGLSAVPWNAAWDAEVQSECADAITAASLATAAGLATVDSNVDAILVDTGTTLPATLSTVEGKVDTVDGVVDAILVDTNELQTDDIPGTLATIAAYIDTEIAAILEDTGTTLPATLSTIEGKVDTIDGIVDNILVDTGTTLESHLTDVKGATFSGATDSLEALRDRGDAAWTTGAGGTPPQLLQSTTIATLASQVSFTLTAGSADDDAYNGAVVVVTDQSTSTQKAYGTVDDYTGSTKTITLAADPAVFTMAAGDTIDIMTPLGSAGSAPTAGQVADAVWDEDQADHVGAGTFGVVASEVADVLADTNELQTDDIPGTLATIDGIADAILVDTGTTLPATLSTIEGKVDTVDTVADGIQTDLSNGVDGLGALKTLIDTIDGVVDAILVDTDSTLPATLATIDGIVDTILLDTAELQTDDIPATLATIAGYLDTEIAAVLEDTGTTLPATLATIDGIVDAIKLVTDALPDAGALSTIDANVDAVLVDTGTTLPAAIADVPTVAEMEARTPTAAQLAYIVANAATGLPVTFTTAGGTTTNAVLDEVDGAAASITADQYNGRLLVFTDGTLKGVVTDITDYDGSDNATITAIPFAPTSSHNARLI